jgi:hypothetical protein
MLNFLNTAVLVAAAAALFPFLLHLFSKRKVKVVPFSSIAFLKAMQRRQVRAIKIKQLLLLIIRTLIVLAVVLAFARPATRGGYLGSHAAVSAVVVLDNSASMGLSVKDGRLFDLGRKKARDIINQLEQSDEAAIITTSGEFSQLAGENAFGNPAAALEFVDRVDITDDRADLMRSYNDAVSLLAERKNLNREIYVISDFQETSFNPDEAAGEFDGKVFLVDLPGEETDNSAVVDVDLGNQLIEVGTSFAVTATVKRLSGAKDEEMLASLYLDDKRVSQSGLRLNAGESGVVRFEAAVGKPGYHTGYVSLSDDDLLADNVHYFTFYIPERFTVLLVGDDDMSARLMRLALAPDENVRRHWSVKQTPYKTFSTVNLADYDVIILNDYATLPEGDVARIKDYVKRGGGLMINLGRDVDSAQYDRSLAGLSGVQVVSAFPKRFSHTGYYLLADFDLEHQILSVFKDAGDNQKLNFKFYARSKSVVSGGDTVQVLARYSDGSPGITVATYGRGRVMLLNADVSPDVTDMSIHPFFVPFAVRSCEYLSRDYSSHTENILAGAAPTRTLRRSFNVNIEYILVMPDGRRKIFTGRHQGDLLLVDCDRLDRSGVYSILNDQAESDRFAVNIDPDEGDLYRADWDELADRLNDAEEVPYTANLAGFISTKRFGRELWQYFLLAALILLALEMLVARDRGAPLPSDE